MIKSAIFDVDGTLLDSMKIWDDAGERYLSSVGKTAENGLSEKLCDMSLTEGAEYMKKQYALSFSTDEIVSGVLKIIEDFYFYEVGLKNDAKETIEELKKQKIKTFMFTGDNIKMIIATSSDKTHIKKAFERLGILKYFTDIVTCSQIGKGKTSPDIYLACADKLGTAPSETLVFEDAVFAAETAHKAGFKTVGVYDESSRNDKNRIKAVCDYYADSFEKAADWGHHLLSL